jgi:hypothetical protein
VGVPEVVVADTGEGGLTDLALQGRAIGLGDHKRIVRYANPEAEKPLGLRNPVRPQLGGHHLRNGHCTGSPGLGRFIADGRAGLLCRLRHRDLAPF